jgi:hypothetical protein
MIGQFLNRQRASFLDVQKTQHQERLSPRTSTTKERLLSTASTMADDSSLHSFSKMGPSSDNPNLLRPYYRAPSIGIPEQSITSGVAPGSPPLLPRRPGGNSSRDFRDMFSDLDYGDYLPESSPSLADMAKSLADRAVWNYTSTVMSQPFEVAKIVLQCYDAGAAAQSSGAVEGRRHYGRESEVCDIKYSLAGNS